MLSVADEFNTPSINNLAVVPDLVTATWYHWLVLVVLVATRSLSSEPHPAITLFAVPVNDVPNATLNAPDVPPAPLKSIIFNVAVELAFINTSTVKSPVRKFPTVVVANDR